MAGSAAGQGERQAAILLPTTIKHLTTRKRTDCMCAPMHLWGQCWSTPCIHLQYYLGLHIRICRHISMLRIFRNRNQFSTLSKKDISLSLCFIPCSHVAGCISVTCLFLSCLHVFTFSCMLSLCLYVSVSSIWANTPARRPYSASLSPSNSPSACGRLLPFRQGPWFLPVGVRWLSCVMCIWELSSSSPSLSLSVSLSLLPSPSRPPPLVLLGCNIQERPCCRKASVQIPVHSPPNGNGSLKQGRLERAESLWLITGCAVTRGNSEDPVGREQGKRERKTERRKKG